MEISTGKELIQSSETVHAVTVAYDAVRLAVASGRSIVGFGVFAALRAAAWSYACRPDAVRLEDTSLIFDVSSYGAGPGGPLRLIDPLTYLRASNISTPEAMFARVGIQQTGLRGLAELVDRFGIV